MAFEVRAEPERNRLHITLTGLASLDDVKQFEADLNRVIGNLPRNRDRHQLLYDVSGATIQSQKVVLALRKLALASPQTSALATVNASTLASLARRQLGRIFLGANMHVFTDRTEAIRWLDAQANR